MSDLISREALVNAIGKHRACSHSMTLSDTDFMDIITNASAVTPQQPQSVADALEEAAKICDKRVMRSWNSESDAYNKCAKECAQAIRALIKRNAVKEGE